MQNAERGKPFPHEPSDDEGFWYPLWYVQATWLEHRQNGNYPAPGGFDDQDARLVIDDWGVLNKRMNSLSDSNRLDELPDFMQHMNPNAPSIEDIIG